MTTEKIYKLLTRGEVGVLKGTEIDQVDGRIFYLLEMLDNGQPVELRRVAQSTFKRWWRLVEDTTDTTDNEAEENAVEEQVETKGQPTIEDLKKFNDAGGQLTEEELQVFKQEATKTSTMEQVIAEQAQAEQEVEQPKKPKPRKIEGVAMGVKELVETHGGEFHLYSEGRGGVIKVGGKPVMFFGLRKHGAIRLFMKEELDETLNCPYPVVESNGYPKQFPFRLDIKVIDEESQDLLYNIFNLYL